MRKVLITLTMSLMIIILLLTVSESPRFGSEDSPVHNYVSRKYIEGSPADTGAVNVVTGIILNYRAFDTLGESTVIFTAVIAVMAVLSKGGNGH